MAFIGTKYNHKLSTKEIAALVRQEIKEALTKNTDPRLPKDLKVSVRIDGNSVYVTIMRVPANWEILTAGFIEQSRTLAWLHPDQRAPRHGPELGQALKALEAMLLAYRKNESDSQSDYFNTNFYPHVEVDRLLESESEKKHETRVNALKLSSLNPELAALLMTPEEKAILPPQMPTGAINGYQAALDMARKSKAPTQPPGPQLPPPNAPLLVTEDILPPYDKLHPPVPAADPSLQEQRERALKDMLAEERATTWELSRLLSRVLSQAQAMGMESALLDEVAKVVREHPVAQAVRQVAADMVADHPDTRYVSTTADMCVLAEQRLRAAGYEFPEGAHIEDF